MADAKLTDLTAESSPSNDDLLYTVDDPSGTPTSKKITWTTIKAFLKTYFDTLYEAIDATILRDADIGSSVQAFNALLADIAGLSVSEGDIFYVNGSGDIVNLGAGTDDQVLTIASGVPSWADAGGGDLNSTVATWQQAYLGPGFLNLADDNTFTLASSNSGALNLTLPQTVPFNTGSTNASGVGLRSITDQITNAWALDAQFGATVWLESTTDQDAFWGMGPTWINNSTGIVDANATNTGKHIGFVVADGTLYATNADGSTQTRTDVSGGITLSDFNVYEFTFDAGTNIVFKINGSIVATHTTNLPATDDSGHGLAFGISNTASADKRMQVVKNHFYTIDFTSATGT